MTATAATLQTSSNLPASAWKQADFGTLTKIGAVSAALAYAAGILTVNIHLHQLGITDFTFARPKLILTGILVLMSFLLLAFFPLCACWEVANPCPSRQVVTKGKIVVVFLIPFVALTVAAAFLCFRPEPGLAQTVVWKFLERFPQKNYFAKAVTTFELAAISYIPICLAAAFPFAAARLLRRASAVDHSHVVWRSTYLFAAVALAATPLLIYIYAFALIFYPAVSISYGGGKPYFANFVIADSGRCELQQLGIPFPEQRNVTDSLPVLHESDVLVAVLLRQAEDQKNDGSWISRNPVVQINKSLITASKVEKVDQDGTPPKLIPMAECISLPPSNGTTPAIGAK